MYSFPLAEKTVCRSPHFCDLMSSSVDNGGLVGGLLRNGIASCSLMKPVSIRMKFKKQIHVCCLSATENENKYFLFVFFAIHKSKFKVIVLKSDLITQNLKLFCHVWVSKLIFYFLRYLTYIFDLIDVKKKRSFVSGTNKLPYPLSSTYHQIHTTKEKNTALLWGFN